MSRTCCVRPNRHWLNANGNSEDAIDPDPPGDAANPEQADDESPPHSQEQDFAERSRDGPA